MSLAGKILRTANRVLSPFALRLTAVDEDFHYRPAGYALDRMASDLAECFATWADAQSVFPIDASRCGSDTVRDFFDAYVGSRFRLNAGGSRFNNLLWLHLIARSMRPSLVVDSGTFTGASAWSLALGAPDASVFSFDIDMSRLRHRDPRVKYYCMDWMQSDWRRVPTGEALCFFDDHVDQARRLTEAHARGLRYLVFDDDFPCTSFAPMAHGGSALPKISFVLDSELDRVDRLEWRCGKSQAAWAVSHARIAEARALIECTARLPNTSLITGIHQTPFRLVRLKRRLPN